MNNDNMSSTDLEFSEILKFLQKNVEHVTCVECCKYFVVPTTASCGHTLCHNCWRTRQTCPSCSGKVNKKGLRLNLHQQSLTEHVHNLAEAFESLFNIKLDNYVISQCDLMSTSDPTKNINEWLANSQNNFSAQAPDSQESTQEINSHVNIVVDDVQIHTENKNKATNNIKTSQMQQHQSDWDKIEQLDSEDVLNKDKENIVGPMDIEYCDYLTNEDKEYSMENPRRSSRKNKDVKDIESNKIYDDCFKNDHKISVDKDSNKLKLNSKNTWNNVKNMKKTFNKLNTNNKNKLNVSVDMRKKIESCDNLIKIKPNKQKDVSYDTSNKTTKIAMTKDSDIKNVSDDKIKKDEIIVVNNKTPDNNNLTTKSLVDNQSNNINYVPHKCPITEEPFSKINDINSIKNKGNVLIPNKNSLHNGDENDPVVINTVKDVRSESCNNDDIEITIKIGNSVTNIVIKKKENMQINVKTDQEIQTSIIDRNLSKTSVSTSPIKELLEEKRIKTAACGNLATEASRNSKKNTASADTSTVHNEITESVERELSTIMENVQTQKRQISSKNIEIKNTKNPFKSHGNAADVEEFLNDLDIFESESFKEGCVQSLKSTKSTPSAIILPTNKSKLKSQRHIEKRGREKCLSETEQCSKKLKMNNAEVGLIQSNSIEQDSANYDTIMSQVFANIDADIKVSHKSKDTIKGSQNLQKTQTAYYKSLNTKQCSLLSQGTKQNLAPQLHSTQIFSENMFSITEKDIEIETKKMVPSLKTIAGDKGHQPVKCQEENIHVTQSDIELVEISTPHDDNDSDKSVVEETPQKTTSFTRKRNNEQERNIDINTQRKNSLYEIQSEDSNNISNVINMSNAFSDTTKKSKNITIIENRGTTNLLETPISIDKFVDQIQYKSTPCARKSLNFIDNQNDLDQTLCPTPFVVAKTTQEKEFMSKAFEQNNMSQRQIIGKKQLNYSVAGSCLSSLQQANVKQLCAMKNFKFLDKYCQELTHLVVGVDEDKMAQRSVKFMCAVAASKWIVSYEWVEKCLHTRNIVDEEPYEVLDAIGDPGPKRSRISKVKLFSGIKFFCLPPFSVLDIATLKEMLESAGGTVVNEAREVRVTESPALLLAEPEHTQEDRFIYMAMQLNIVPVNYEWALNCIGSYTLGPIHDLLLCPESLLPAATTKWPTAIITRE